MYKIEYILIKLNKYKNVASTQNLTLKEALSASIKSLQMKLVTCVQIEKTLS